MSIYRYSLTNKNRNDDQSPLSASTPQARYNQQQPMTSNIECSYKSFQQFGSIYTSSRSTRSLEEQLKNLNIQAVINLSPKTIIKLQSTQELQVLSLPTFTKDTLDLKHSFQRSFDFITKNRGKTNILIFGEENNLSYVFLFAYLMKKYNYTLTHVYKMYNHNTKNVQFSPQIIEQLRIIPYSYSLQPKQEDNSVLKDSKIGRRIRRIQLGYSNLTKNSRSSSKVSKNQNHYNLQITKPAGFDFFAQKCHLGFDDLSPINIKQHNRHAKRISDFY